ncbi:MAG: hypothetical protein WAT81_00250 [Candidatus Moraniibacteriota bacterium]
MQMEQSFLTPPVAPEEEIPTPEVSDVDIDTLTHEEIVTFLPGLSRDQLMAGYKKFVGIDPKWRSLDDGQLRTGISDPKAEQDRIAAIDRAADKEDLQSPYVR